MGMNENVLNDTYCINCASEHYTCDAEKLFVLHGFVTIITENQMKIAFNV